LQCFYTPEALQTTVIKLHYEVVKNIVILSTELSRVTRLVAVGGRLTTAEV